MDISQLTDAHWARINAAAEKLCGEPDFRYLAERELDDTALTFTREPVANFDHARLNSWHVPGRRREDENAVYYWSAEALRGRRHDLAIIDCGDFRAIIQI